MPPSGPHSAEDFVDHNPHVARRHQRHAVHFGQIVGGVTQNGVDGEDTKITMLQYQVVLMRKTARMSLSWNDCFLRYWHCVGCCYR